MRINKNYLNRFIKTKSDYLYPIKNGIYLAFNKDYEYKGVEMFYSYDYVKVEKVAEEKLEELIAKDLIEV